MITIERLNQFGADTATGLSRCMNNDAFYLRLVAMGLQDKNFDALRDAVAAGDAAAAFEAAHALKGMIGNLALTPVYTPLCELTELLRGKDTLPDVSALLDQVMAQLENARALGK